MTCVVFEVFSLWRIKEPVTSEAFGSDGSDGLVPDFHFICSRKINDDGIDAVVVVVVFSL